MRHLAKGSGWTDLEVSSAGTWATDGTPITEFAGEVLAEEGMDGSQHRARTVTSDLIEEADVVVAMTSVHLREIASVAPGSEGKTFLMKEIVELGEGDPSTGLEGVLAAARPEWRRALDLDDPMGLPLDTYRRCYGEISAGVSRLAERLRSA